MPFTTTRDLTDMPDITLVELLPLLDEQIEKGPDQWTRAFFAGKKGAVKRALLQRAARRFVEQGDELTRLRVVEDIQMDLFIRFEEEHGGGSPQAQAVWEVMGDMSLRVLQAESALLELFIKTVKQEANE